MTALQAGRLNAVGDVVERWRTECAVTALTPFGNPVEGPGHYLDGSGRRRPSPVSRHDGDLASVAPGRPAVPAPRHPLTGRVRPVAARDGALGSGG